MKASELMTSASRILLDEDYTRWTMTELAEWLTAALREVALHVPTATSRNIVIPLVEGTFQRLPADCQQVLRVVRNVDVEGDNRVGKGVITIVDRQALDSQNPNWHDGQYVRFRPYARHFIFDETDPLTFYVWPGNDGSGHVEPRHLAAMARRGWARRLRLAAQRQTGDISQPSHLRTCPRQSAGSPAATGPVGGRLHTPGTDPGREGFCRRDLHAQ